MRILITGSVGQLGKSIAQLEFFQNKGVIFCDKKELDLTDSDSIKLSIESFEPNIVINTAAYTNVRLAEEEVEKTFAVNSVGLKNLANKCFEDDIFLIHISTDYVFDGKKNSPYIENDRVSPLNIYGKSKLAGENAIRSSLCKHIILRTSWLFSEYSNNFVTNVILSSHSKESFQFIDDQFGSPTSCVGLSRAIEKICKKIIDGYPVEEGVFNFSGESTVSWYDFALKIYEEASKIGLISRKLKIEKISSFQYKDPVQRPKYSVLSNTKINESLEIASDNWKEELLESLKKLRNK